MIFGFQIRWDAVVYMGDTAEYSGGYTGIPRDTAGYRAGYRKIQ